MNNSITIVGHVGQAPHSVSFGDTGNNVAKFSVAVKEFSSINEENRTCGSMLMPGTAWLNECNRSTKYVLAQAGLNMAA